ncbi:unnamed protein product [Mytilus edulis]|uniref:Uncharacterized protein n=1 Tax=Mytilus edulis TaxID=6550 RepID=A0A8S3SCB3_MYTED|nr:unnamed protein product [Mytilus edulis]
MPTVRERSCSEKRGQSFKIKTHLNVKEIEEFRKLENNGKIEIFKSISKPDSASRISTYAKRLQIEYDENQSTSAAKHSDDLIHINPFNDDDVTRKDLLLRQISDLNDRFNAVREKERAFEHGLVPNKSTIISVKTNKKIIKSNSDDETDQCDRQQRTNVGQSETSHKNKVCRRESVLRPSTSFAFSSNKHVHDVIRPATSLGNCISELFEKKKKKSSAIKRSKSVKVAPSKESEYTQEFKTVKNSKSKSVNRTKSLKKATSFDSSTEKEIIPELDEPHLADNSFCTEPTFQTEKNPIDDHNSEEGTERFKVRPSTAISSCTDNSTPRSAAMSALSGRSEAVANIIACMNGPQHAPFDCHAAAEEWKKNSIQKQYLKKAGPNFLSRDSVESNLGHDLHQELRKELIQEEEKKQLKIEDKICSFMDRLNEKLKSEKPAKEPWSVQTSMLSVNDSLKRQSDVPEIKRINMKTK